MRTVIRTGFVVLASASVICCGGLAEKKTEVSQTRQAAAVDYFLKIDGIVGESKDNNHKQLVAIESFSFGPDDTGSMTGSVRVVFDCIDALCDGVSMSAKLQGSDGDADAGAPLRVHGAWELLGPPGPNGDPMHVIMVVNDPGDGSLQTKLASVEEFGQNAQAASWSTMMRASQLSCQDPPTCETDAIDAPTTSTLDGATWECFPTCTPCLKCPR